MVGCVDVTSFVVSFDDSCDCIGGGKWVGVPTLKGNFGDHMHMPTNKPTNGLDMRLKHQQPLKS